MLDLSANPGGTWLSAELNRSVYILVTHSAVGVNFGALHGDGDTVEEDEGKDHVVKKLVSNNSLTQDPEPEWRSMKPQEGRLASHSDQKEARITVHTQGPEWLKGRDPSPFL